MDRVRKSKVDEFFPSKKRRYLNSGDPSACKSDSCVQQVGSLFDLSISNTQSRDSQLAENVIQLQVANKQCFESRDLPGTFRRKSVEKEFHSEEDHEQVTTLSPLRCCSRQRLKTPNVQPFLITNDENENLVTGGGAQTCFRESLQAGNAIDSKKDFASSDASQREEHKKEFQGKFTCRADEDNRGKELTEFANDFLSICCSGVGSAKISDPMPFLECLQLQHKKHTCFGGGPESECNGLQRHSNVQIQTLEPRKVSDAGRQNACHEVLKHEGSQKEGSYTGIKSKQFSSGCDKGLGDECHKYSFINHINLSDPELIASGKVNAVTIESLDVNQIPRVSDNSKSPEVSSYPSLSIEKRKIIATPQTGSVGRRKRASRWVSGNSLFSPGDEFWDEAIHWADGLASNKADDNAHVTLTEIIPVLGQMYAVTPHQVNCKASWSEVVCARRNCKQSRESVMEGNVVQRDPEESLKKVPVSSAEVYDKRDSEPQMPSKCQVKCLEPLVGRSTHERVCSSTEDASKVSVLEGSPLPIRRFDFSSQENLCIDFSHANGSSFGRKSQEATNCKGSSHRLVKKPVQTADFVEAIGCPCNFKRMSHETLSEENCQRPDLENPKAEGPKELNIGNTSNLAQSRTEQKPVETVSVQGCDEYNMKVHQAAANAPALKPNTTENKYYTDSKTPSADDKIEDSIVHVTPEGLSSSKEVRKNLIMTKIRITEEETGHSGSSNTQIADANNVDFCDWLPMPICSVYSKKGLKKFYPWQVDCLQLDGVLQGKNLVYCASTSAGKSLVAEVLMLRRVLSTGKKALLVLPYVSICSEKAEHLESLVEPLGKKVCNFFGTQGSASLPTDACIAVCTIEKANSLLNKLLEERRLPELAVVVIDELHMVGDRDRGYLLELMLTKLRYATGEGKDVAKSVDNLLEDKLRTVSGSSDQGSGLQIIGMSATMPNAAAVAEWLQAALYETEFRPVPLVEFLKVGNSMYNKNMEVVRILRKGADLAGKDPDHIVELCHEVVQEGHSVLLFCSSRKACETSAKHVAKFLPALPVTLRGNSSGPESAAIALDELQKCPSGLDPVLAETLPKGVAYHHAGLTVEEREMVEMCYRSGIVRVLTATSTLAAGVNLPARRVIFRQPRIGRDFIDGTRYRQMAGRAGRAGIDIKGESVLICKPEELKRMSSLLNDGCQPLHSCLAEDKNGMTRAILEVVAGGIVQTANDVQRYVKCTLLNSTEPFEEVVKSAQDSLHWLCHTKFLEWDTTTELYSSTPLGKAAFGSSLSPEESLVVFEDLAKAREAFVLASDLHLVYQVTPIYVDLEPDWSLYYKKFVELSPLDQAVGNRVGVMEPFLMRMAHGAPILEFGGRGIGKSPKRKAGVISPPVRISRRNLSYAHTENLLRVCKRFYVSLILARLIQEASLIEVCESFKVARGTVQALQESSGRFASMVSAFCERLGWHDLEGLVSKFQSRVSFGVRAEIVELTEIPLVKASRARALYKAGLRSLQAVAEATLSELAKALFESSCRANQDGLRINVQNRMQMGMAKKIKYGARKLVLDRAEAARVAAFSAFRALGLDVPAALSQPLVVNNEKEKEEHALSVSALPTHTHAEDGVSELNEKCDQPEIHERSGRLAVLVSETVPQNGDDTLHCGSNVSKPSCSEVPNKPHSDDGERSKKSPVDVDELSGGFDEFFDCWQGKTVFFF